MLVVWLMILLDLGFKDPHFMYHPVQFFGLLIDRGEVLVRKYSKSHDFRMMGVLLVILVVVVVLGVYTMLSIALNQLDSYYGMAFNLYLGYALLASGSLMEEGRRIYRVLIKEDMDQARLTLSYLVSRDTGDLCRQDLIRSAIETLSENITDGIISPLFYYAIFGIEGMLIYKVVNTFDSMIGYKNEKYIDLGRFAAKLDDVLNFIPARLAAGLVMISAFVTGADYKGAYRIFVRDHRNHSSPNSACTEAAVAGALGIKLGGKTSYFGQMVDKPTIGDGEATDDVELILKVNKLILMSTLWWGGFLTILFIVRGDFVGF